MCKISNREDIHEIVKDKLYYKIKITGAGEEIKSINKAPLICFRERALDGETLSENTSGVRISLSEMIPGLRKALQGMRVGFAYREFPKPEPYSLIIIEVSLVSL